MAVISVGSEEARRATAYDVVRRELEIAGERRRKNEPVSELSGLVRLARSIRMQVTRIGAAAGLTRPTVYDVLTGHQPTIFDPDFERVALLAYLAVNGISAPTGIASELRLERDGVVSTLRRLATAGLVGEGAVGYGTTMDPVFGISAAGEQALRERVELLRGHQVEGYAFYIEVSEDERDAIEQAASRLLGRSDFNVLGVHIARAMRMPELALVIRADDDRDAFAIANEIWNEVLKRAKLPPRSPHISLALRPRSRR